MKHSDDFVDAITYGVQHGTASFRSSMLNLQSFPKSQPHIIVPPWPDGGLSAVVKRVKSAINASRNKRCVRVLTKDYLALRHGPSLYRWTDHSTYSTKTLLYWIEQATVREVSKRLLRNEIR